MQQREDKGHSFASPSPPPPRLQVLECSVFPDGRRGWGRWQSVLYWPAAVGGSCSWLLVIYADGEQVFLGCYPPLCHACPDEEPSGQLCLSSIAFSSLRSNPSQMGVPLAGGLMASAYSSNPPDIHVESQKLLQPPDPKALQTRRRWFLCFFPGGDCQHHPGIPSLPAPWPAGRLGCVYGFCTTVGIWPRSESGPTAPREGTPSPSL